MSVATIRRTVLFAAAIGLTALMSAWATAGAATPRSQSMLPTMHFRVVTTAQHLSPNGATPKNPAGASYQETFRLVSRGHEIGSGLVIGTIANKSGASLQNIQARFPGRGTIELQGVADAKGNGPSVIVGGTGVFAHAAGHAVSRKNHVTVTFS